MYKYIDQITIYDYDLEQFQWGLLYPYQFLIDILYSIKECYEEDEEQPNTDAMITLIEDIECAYQEYKSGCDKLIDIHEKCIKLLVDTCDRKNTEKEFIAAVTEIINEYIEMDIPTGDDIPSDEEICEYEEEWVKSQNELYVEYVPENVRDLKIELENKPDTIKDLMLFTYIDTDSYGYTTPMADIFGEKYKIYRHNERVGLDQCAFSLRVEEVNEELLEKAKENKKAKFHYISDNDPDAENTSLILPGVKKKYSNITLLTGTYSRINIQKNNFNYAKGNKKDNIRGGMKSDSVLLHIYVEPVAEHEILGNFRNYSHSEMLKKIYEAMDIAEDYGVKFDREMITLNYIELNSTFHIGYPFEYLEEPLKYFFTRLSKNRYTCAEYIKQDNKKYGNKTARSLSVQGMSAYNASMSVKIYDKAYETKKSAMATIDGIKDIVFDLKDLSFVRVEYSIKKTKILNDNFGTINFLELDDTKLQKVFVSLTEKYFKKPYKDYVEEAKIILKDIVKDIVPRKNSQWKIQLLKDIRDSQKFMESTPIYLGDSDVTYIVECNNIFYNNVAYYKPIITKLLAASDRFVLPGDNSRYAILANFFAKTYFQKTLSDKRRVGYAVEYKNEDYKEE